jgi:hypothetical protein
MLVEDRCGGLSFVGTKQPDVGKITNFYLRDTTQNARNPTAFLRGGKLARQFYLMLQGQAIKWRVNFPKRSRHICPELLIASCPLV